MALSINPLACPQNHPCPITRVCPVGAISQVGYGLPVIDEAICTECGKCTNYCPMRAVENIN
jgi:ferredoxin